MKTFFLTLIILAAWFSSYSQTTDTIAIYDPVKPQGMMEALKGNNRAEQKQLSQTEVFINNKKGTNANDESMVVVIDNKIYAANAPEFRSLNPQKVKNVNIIYDKDSKNKVKSILLITTK